MLRVLSHILPDKLFLELAAGLIDGVPNHLVAEIKEEETREMLQRNKLSNIASNPELVEKAILKEERNHLSLTFSRLLVYYTPNIGRLIMGILNKLHKKPRVYRHAGCKPHEDIHPINSLVDVALTEPEIGYGTTLYQHCQYLWRIAMIYPNCIIDSYDDDVSGAFPQLVFHPDITRANFSLYNNIMIASIALHFGSSWGPASWEPLARARCFISQWLFMHIDYQIKINQEALDLFTIATNCSNTKEFCQVVPIIDQFNEKVTDKNGNFIPEFRMFVDDLLSAIPRHLIMTNLLIVSSIEAVYILLGYPGPIKKPYLTPTMAWDKMAEKPVGPERVSLGTNFINIILVIAQEDYKIERIL